MKRLFITALALALALVATSGVASAGRLDDLTQRLGRLEAHHTRLERQLAEQTKRIRRLKLQKSGVGRDLQLRSALRSSQQLAARLTKLRQRARLLADSVIALYDKAIKSASGKARRRALRAKRRALVLRHHGKRSGANVVLKSNARAYDSPEDVNEKADLLADSEEKVRRQLERLHRRLARLEHRARLRRHGRAADDSPFVESAPRRTSRTSTASGKGGARNSADPSTGNANSRSPGEVSGGGAGQSTQPPAAPANPGAFQGNKGTAPAPGGLASDADGALNVGGGSRASSAASVRVRDVLDPALLRKLQRAGQSGSPKSRIAELRKATARLRALAARLRANAKALRERAKRMKRTRRK